MRKKIIAAMFFCMSLWIGATSVLAIQFGNDSYTLPNWGGQVTGSVMVQCDGDSEKKASFNVTYSNTVLNKSVALAKENSDASKWVSAPQSKWVYPEHTVAVAPGVQYNSKAKSNNLEPTNGTKISFQFSPDYLPNWTVK